MGGERSVSFRYSGPIPANNLLATLDVLVLLGQSDTTSLRWEDVSARLDGSPLVVESRDGDFTTLGICRIDGDRYVRLDGLTAVGRIIPNPASATASLDVVAASQTTCTIRIIDRLGGEAAAPRSIELAAGRHRIDIDVESLPAGLYFYELRSAGAVVRGELSIVR
jgi:hypothetical protein